jgi:hypothetical protein
MTRSDGKISVDFGIDFILQYGHTYYNQILTNLPIRIVLKDIKPSASATMELPDLVNLIQNDEENRFSSLYKDIVNTIMNHFDIKYRDKIGYNVLRKDMKRFLKHYPTHNLFNELFSKITEFISKQKKKNHATSKHKIAI